MLAALERVAGTLDIEVRRETLEIGDSRLPGGLCRIDDRPVCILSASLEPSEAARILGSALLRLGLEDVFVPPIVREFLDSLTDGRDPAGRAGPRGGLSST